MYKGSRHEKQFRQSSHMHFYFIFLANEWNSHWIYSSNTNIHILIIRHKCQIWLHDRVNEKSVVHRHAHGYNHQCSSDLWESHNYYCKFQLLVANYGLIFCFERHINSYIYCENLFNLGMLCWHFSILSCHVTWV